MTSFPHTRTHTFVYPRGLRIVPHYQASARRKMLTRGWNQIMWRTGEGCFHQNISSSAKSAVTPGIYWHCIKKFLWWKEGKRRLCSTLLWAGWQQNCMKISRRCGYVLVWAGEKKEKNKKHKAAVWGFIQIIHGWLLEEMEKLQWNVGVLLPLHTTTWRAIKLYPF